MFMASELNAALGIHAGRGFEELTRKSYHTPP